MLLLLFLLLQLLLLLLSAFTKIPQKHPQQKSQILINEQQFETGQVILFRAAELFMGPRPILVVGILFR